MTDSRLREELSDRLNDFAREMLVSQADRACGLFKLLLENEGALVESNGQLFLNGRNIEKYAGKFASIVHEGTGFDCAFVFDETVSATSGAIDRGTTMPQNVVTSCYVRDSRFTGDAIIGGTTYQSAARTLFLEAGVRAMVFCAASESQHQHGFGELASIQNEVIAIAKQVQEGRESSISDFVSVIRGIAKRIHLLALNASILSAQAGEHGRGFSVVAREIGELAERTRQSTQELEKDFLGKSVAIDVDRRSGGRKGQ